MYTCTLITSCVSPGDSSTKGLCNSDLQLHHRTVYQEMTSLREASSMDSYKNHWKIPWNQARPTYTVNKLNYISINKFYTIQDNYINMYAMW